MIKSSNISNTYSYSKENSFRGEYGGSGTTTFIISNEKTNDNMKIVIFHEDPDLLLLTLDNCN